VAYLFLLQTLLTMHVPAFQTYINLSLVTWFLTLFEIGLCRWINVGAEELNDFSILFLI